VKLGVKAIPEKGEANKQIVLFLSQLFEVSENSVNIQKGESSKDKVIWI